MSRPLKQGEEAISQDVMALTKVMRRIQGDPKRPDKEKDEMVGHLKAVLALLLTGKRARRPIKSKALEA